MEKQDISVVLSGGGVNGLVYCGVLKAYQELKYDLIYNVTQVIGISIGSIFGLLWIINYSHKELQKHLTNLQFDDFNEFNFELLFTKYGLNTGNHIINQVEELMNKKGIDNNITLQELQKKFNIDFAVVLTNLNKHCLEMISYKQYPKIRVLDAIRMAISIPLLFTAKRFNNYIYVDAALISNYPLEFISKYTDNETVFGINIASISTSTEIINIGSYIKCVIKCMRNKSSISKDTSIKTCNINCSLINKLVYGDFEVLDLDKYIELGYNSFIESSFL
jgi:predicted acylesterase/phospholipase RssA